MESGISDGWEVIREDEDAERIRTYLDNYYIEHRDKIIARAKKWDLEHPERRTEIWKSQIERCHRVPDYWKYRDFFRAARRKHYQKIKDMDKRKKIICIYGMSGTGKTTASLFLEKKFGVNVICSYTTRPMRCREKNGVDHWFVKTVPPKDELLAYTRYGGYEYYAKKEDVTDMINVYVVDEEGIRQLLKMQDEFRIYPVRIESTKNVRRLRGVLPVRIGRDAERDTSGVRARVIIRNNGTLKEFKKDLVDMFNRLVMY